MAPASVAFHVFGLPEAKGSTRAFLVKGRPVVTSSNRNLAAWEARIAAVAQTVATGQAITGAVTLDLAFRLPRPKRAKLGALHTTRPDLDKLVRACADALIGVLYLDDAQVIQIRASKHYAAAGEVPSVRIEVVDLANIPRPVHTLPRVSSAHPLEETRWPTR